MVEMVKFHHYMHEILKTIEKLYESIKLKIGTQTGMTAFVP